MTTKWLIAFSVFIFSSAAQVPTAQRQQTTLNTSKKVRTAWDSRMTILPCRTSSKPLMERGQVIILTLADISDPHLRYHL